MSVVYYEPGKVREAAQEFEAAWQQLWRGDKHAVVRQIEEMYGKVAHEAQGVSSASSGFPLS